MLTSNMIHLGITTNPNASQIITCSDYQWCQLLDVDIEITYVKKIYPITCTFRQLCVIFENIKFRIFEGGLRIA